MTAHNWSGWPGAWCLSCGISDPYEQALADDALTFDDEGKESGFKDPEREAAVKAAMICPEPGSNRHNPYGKQPQ